MGSYLKKKTFLPCVSYSFLNIYFYLFIWLRWVLVPAHEIFSCTLPVQPSSSSLTRDRTHAPCMGVWSLDHWTRRKSLCHILKAVFCSQGTCRRSGYVSLKSSYLSGPFAFLLFFHLSATQWSVDSMTVCVNETPFPSPSPVPVLSPDTHILVVNASCSPAISHV